MSGRMHKCREANARRKQQKPERTNQSSQALGRQASGDFRGREDLDRHLQRTQVHGNVRMSCKQRVRLDYVDMHMCHMLHMHMIARRIKMQDLYSRRCKCAHLVTIVCPSHLISPLRPLLRPPPSSGPKKPQPPRPLNLPQAWSNWRLSSSCCGRRSVLPGGIRKIQGGRI